MEIIFFIIFLIGAIITFITKDKRFPDHPYLGWVVCMIGIAVGLYIVYSTIDSSVKDAARGAAFNEGYRDGLK